MYGIIKVVSEQVSCAPASKSIKIYDNIFTKTFYRMWYIYIYCYKIRTRDKRWPGKLAPVVKNTLEWIIKTDVVVYNTIFMKTKAQFSWNPSAKTRSGTWSADRKMLLYLHNYIIITIISNNNQK